jgi:hypothetical protein
MIHDPLEWSDPQHHQQLEAWTRADALLAPDRRMAVVGQLRSWAQAHLAAVDDRTAIENMQLSTDCPADLREALSKSATREPYSEWQLLAWSVRAEALVAEFLATAPSCAVAGALYDFGDAPASFWRALEHQLAHAKGEHREAWIQFLATAPSDLVMSRSPETEPTSVQMASAWTQRRDPFAIFDVDYRRYRSSRGMVADWVRRRMSLLLSLSPVAWMRALDELPLPTLMWEAVALSQLRSNPPPIQHLIVNAPAVFDTDGAWTGSVAALLVSDLVADQLHAIHGAVRGATEAFGTPAAAERATRAKQKLQQLERDELLAWATSAYTPLLHRPDGEAIAFELLARLCRTEILGEWNHQRNAWSANQTALSGMARALVDRRVPLPRLEAWWKEREGDAARRHDAAGKPRDLSAAAPALFAEGLSYLIGAIHVLHARHPNPREALGDDAALLWTWAEQLFLGRDPGLALLPHARSQAGIEWLGYLLAAQHQPGEAWRSIYARLAPQRRRHARCMFEPLHGSHDLGFVALLGLIGWNESAPAAERPDILRFYRDLQETAWQLYLTAPSVDRRQEARLASECFAPARSLFGEGLGDFLIETLGPLANDPVMVRNICRVLRRNQVANEVIDRVCERLAIDLASMRALADRISPAESELGMA